MSLDTLYVSKDVYIDQNAPTTNYGSSQSVIPRSYASNRNCRVLLKFDISSYQGLTISSVLLKLKNYYFHGSGRLYRVHPLTRSNWVENQATWNIYATGSSWSNAGGDYTEGSYAEFYQPVSTYTWSEVDITTLFNNALSGGSLDLLIKDSAEDNATQADTSYFSYRNHVLNGAKLEITYTCPDASITTASLSDADYNSAYSDTLEATPTGGTWSVISGALPTGLSLNESTGVISGTATEMGDFTFTVRYTCGSPCDSKYADQEYTISVYDIAEKTVSELVSSVTETISKETSTFDISRANNAKAYALNLKTGYWTHINNCPFVNAIYRTNTKEIIGARRDKGQISVINYGNDFDGTDIESVIKHGQFNLGQIDEVAQLNDRASEAIKKLRAYFADVVGEGNMNLVIYTENDTDGKEFIIPLKTVDNSTMNKIRVALSRDINGKYFSLKLSNRNGWDFWIGEQRIKVKAKSLK